MPHRHGWLEKWRLRLWGAGFLLLALTLAQLAPAAQFSAQMDIKDGDKHMLGRLFVHDGMMRQEFADESGQTITIVRPDKKVVWIIIPWKQSYLELPYKGQLPGQFLQIPPDAMSRRAVGQEQVQGYDAEKFEVLVRSGGPSGCDRQTVWHCPKLGMPVKMICKDRDYSVEYKNIREGPQPERLFNLPPGCQKLDNPAGFGFKLQD